MKKLSILIACAIVGVSAHAATVNWSAQSDTGFATSTGLALAQGNYIRLGYFTISDSAVAALAVPTLSNVATLNSNFVQFGLAQVGDTFGVDGFFQKASNFSYAANPTFDFTKQIYIWVLKAGTNSNLGAALGSATEQAIFYEPFATNSQWQFPATDISTAKSPDIGDAKPPAGGVYLAGSHQASNAALTSINGGTPTGAVTLQAVPEPSSAILIGIGILGFLGRRRPRCS